MSFTDPQLQRCYETNLAGAADLSAPLRQVSALIAVHGVFQMFEGSHSPRVHETIEHLLLPGVRPGLRGWYQRTDADHDSGAVALRERLNLLAGEKLEEKISVPRNSM